MGCILLVPEWIYTDYLFSAEFKGIRKVIGGLSIGIVALGCNSIISHYFIGSGKIRYSTASSCVGLIALLISGFLLIPSYGVVGSAITTSIAFTSMLVFSLTVFSRQTLTRWNEFLPDKKTSKLAEFIYKNPCNSITNFIDNAIKFTEKGTITLEMISCKVQLSGYQNIDCTL